ncbi:MAG: hypothetical protein ACOYN0_01790 [Phycisphaerales bacterium]
MTLPKIGLPEGRQIWLRAGEIAWVTPTGRYAEQVAGSRGFDFQIAWNASWKDWRPLALRPSRQGTWIQSFLWIPLAPLAALSLLLGFAALVRTRRNPVACQACAYDRCGLPPSVPCPECGQTPA